MSLVGSLSGFKRCRYIPFVWAPILAKATVSKAYMLCWVTANRGVCCLGFVSPLSFVRRRWDDSTQSWALVSLLISYLFFCLLCFWFGLVSNCTRIYTTTLLGVVACGFANLLLGCSFLFYRSPCENSLPLISTRLESLCRDHRGQ